MAPSEREDGLLGYLEDIIGTSLCKSPIDKALIEMERLTEEKLNRLRVVERERNALEKEVRSRKLLTSTERPCTRTVHPLVGPSRSSIFLKATSGGG
jgi:hypothetical protein